MNNSAMGICLVAVLITILSVPMANSNKIVAGILLVGGITIFVLGLIQGTLHRIIVELKHKDSTPNTHTDARK